MYYPDLLPPSSYDDNSINAVTTRFVKTATNKMRCPIFCMAWTPEGRRLVTGASSGEFTLWNGLTFNFETILQAHDNPIRTMVWSHNESWMVTGDHSGYVKYWQTNMNNVKMFQAHKEAVRGFRYIIIHHSSPLVSHDTMLFIRTTIVFVYCWSAPSQMDFLLLCFLRWIKIISNFYRDPP
ncbi:GSCOCG00008708001-RA-CDS [Cotesia congregata]|nr:GSCOCG00008708001-RA-CDS [Cotesia congregata]